MPEEETGKADQSSLSIQDSNGAELLKDGISSPDLVATDGKGEPLTLLEEFSNRREKVTGVQLALTCACAAASVVFAYLTFLKTH